PDQPSAASLAAQGPRAERWAHPRRAGEGVLTQEAVTEALGADVPPREAAERVTFATWAIVTGKSPGCIFNPLPALDDETAEKMAQRRSERAEATIAAEDVKTAPTIEALATIVREHLEAGELDGFVRTLRAPQQEDDKVPVFVFHPAGGSTVVYEPLLKRLPPDTPMYGIERVEGSIEVRAAEEVPQTKEETRARWDRYARFAERTFNVEVPPIPYEQLENLDDEGQVQFVLDAVSQSGVQIPGGIIE